MKLRIFVGAAAAVVMSAGLVHGAYLIELDGGDRMTVDSYWTEGDRIHLVTGGSDLSLPRTRVRSIGQAPSERPRSSDPKRGGLSRETSGSIEELEARQNAIEHHLLRVQQEKFEAAERGDPPARVGRLEREFRRTQERNVAVKRALERERGE